MPTHSKNYDTTPVDGLPHHVSIADLWSGQEVQFTYISPKGKSELVTKKVVDINRETEVVTFLWKTGEVFPVPVSVASAIAIRPTYLTRYVDVFLQFVDLRNKEKFLILHVAIPILDLDEEVQQEEDSLNESIFNMSLDAIDAVNSSDDEASTSGLLNTTSPHLVCL